MLLRPKTGLEDMIDRDVAGHRRRAARAGGLDGPGQEHAARRQARRDPREPGPRHARLPAAARRRAPAAAWTARATTWPRRSSASSPARASCAASPTALEDRRDEHPPLDPQLARCSSRRSARRTTQLAQLIDSSNAVFRSFANQDANLRSALQQLPPTLRQTNSALDKRRPARARPRARRSQDLRPTARALGPTLRQVRPFLRETTPIIRDAAAAVRPRRPADGQGAARPPRATSPTVTPDLVETLRVVNYLFNTLAYNPPGDRGGLPLLGRLGEPPRRARLQHAGRARPDPPRHGHHLLRQRPRARHDHRGRPAPRHASPQLTEPADRAPQICPQSSTQARSTRTRAAEAADAEAGPDHRPDARDGGLRALLLRRCCCSCGWPSAADPAQAEGLPLQVSFARGARSSPTRPTCGSPACRSARSRSSSPTRRRAARVATIEIEEQYAPISKDTKAILRQKTLLGETYVELTPGNPERRHGARGRPAAPPGRCPTTVELDEIFRAFDPKTRRAFQTWMQEQARGGRRPRARHLRHRSATSSRSPTTRPRSSKVLNAQEGAVSQLVRNTGAGVRRAQRAARPAAGPDPQLQHGLRRRPPSATQELRETFTRAADVQPRGDASPSTASTQFARDTDPLVTQLRPAARELQPDVPGARRRSRRTCEALFRDLDPLITRPRRACRRLQQFLERPAAGARRVRPAAQAAQPDPQLPGQQPQRAARVLRQLAGGDAGDARRTACTTCGRRTR